MYDVLEARYAPGIRLMEKYMSLLGEKLGISKKKN